MTPEQCQTIRNAIPKSFPSIQMWWDRLKDDETRAAMTRRNTTCLIDCDYDDCVAVLKDFLRSDVDPWPFDSDKERSAAIIAKAANERRRERKERGRASGSFATGTAYTRTGATLTIWEQADKLAKYRASEGWTKEGDEDLLAEMLGPEDSSDRRNWVSCRECRDTGIVQVLSTIKWVRPWREGSPFIVHTTAAAACSCAAASEYLNSKNPLNRFDPMKQCRLPPVYSGAEAGKLFVAWREMIEKSKRVGVFDDYNARNQAEEFV